jgi:hypothetical protein
VHIIMQDVLVIGTFFLYCDGNYFEIIAVSFILIDSVIILLYQLTKNMPLFIFILFDERRQTIDNKAEKFC